MCTRKPLATKVAGCVPQDFHGNTTSTDWIKAEQRRVQSPSGERTAAVMDSAEKHTAQDGLSQGAHTGVADKRQVQSVEKALVKMHFVEGQPPLPQAELHVFH